MCLLFLRLQLLAQQLTKHLLEQTWSRLDLGDILRGNAAGTVLSCTISTGCMSKRIRNGILTDLQLMKKCRAKTSVGASPPRLPARPLLAPLAQGNPGGKSACSAQKNHRLWLPLAPKKKMDHGAW